MKKLAWCFVLLLVTVAASAQTQAPNADEPNLSAMGMSIKAFRIERNSADRLGASGSVEVAAGNVTITSKEATFQWSADKHWVEIRPTGEVIVRLTAVSSPK